MSSILLIQSDDAARTHLIHAINLDTTLSVSGAVDTLAQAREAIAKRIPDLLIGDLRLPDGAFMSLVQELRPGRSHVMVMTGSLRDPHLMRALSHGADAYALSGRPPEAMLGLIRQVLGGESPMAPEIARAVLAHFDTQPARDAPLGRYDPRALNSIDRLLLQWLGEGYLLQEIARGLETTPQLVGLRIRSLYRKMHLEQRDRPFSPSRW